MFADLCSDMRKMDCERSLVIEPVKPQDLPTIKMLIVNAVCKNATLSFVRDKEEALHGSV